MRRLKLREAKSPTGSPGARPTAAALPLPPPPGSQVWAGLGPHVPVGGEDRSSVGTCPGHRADPSCTRHRSHIGHRSPDPGSRRLQGLILECCLLTGPGTRGLRPVSCLRDGAACAAPGATGRKGRLARARPATSPCWPRPRIYRLKKEKNPTGSLRATGKPAVPQQLPPGIPTAGNSPSACGAAGGQGEWCRGGPPARRAGDGGSQPLGKFRGAWPSSPWDPNQACGARACCSQGPALSASLCPSSPSLKPSEGPSPLWSPTQKCPSITGLRMARLAVWTLGGPGPL